MIKESNNQETRLAITKNILALKLFLYGDPTTKIYHKNDAKTLEQVGNEILKQPNFLIKILTHIKLLEFEAIKYIAQIYAFLLKNIHTKEKFIVYFTRHNEIITLLVNGYNDGEFALHTGLILREEIRHSQLNVLFQNSVHFEEMFTYVESPLFEVATDAYSTLEIILKDDNATEVLDLKYNLIKRKFNKIIKSSNFVMQCSFLKLLGDLLRKRSNFNFRKKYTDDHENLQIIMELLRETKLSIQLGALHVLKVFLLNPEKEEKINTIICRNLSNLLELLRTIQQSQEDEEEESDQELNTIIKNFEEIQKT